MNTSKNICLLDLEILARNSNGANALRLRKRRRTSNCEERLVRNNRCIIRVPQFALRVRKRLGDEWPGQQIAV